MQVRVLLFAAHREAVGRSELTVETEEGTTVEELYQSLAANHPGLNQLLQYTTFALNREVVSGDARLSRDDEVAFLQPLSGGAA